MTRATLTPAVLIAALRAAIIAPRRDSVALRVAAQRCDRSTLDIVERATLAAYLNTASPR